MFDKEFIARLRKTNISKNEALTKDRVVTVWDSSSREQQHEVLALADVSMNTLYRVRRTGVISARIAIAMGQALNVSPYYLIGADVVFSEFNFDAAKKFLAERGYSSAVVDFDRKNKKAKKVAEAEAEAVVEEIVEEVADAIAVSAIQHLSEEDMFTLLRGLIIKASSGKPAAIKAMTQITDILLS